MTLQRSTKLDAVNSMLTTIGGSPVNSLTDDSNMDLLAAISILDETNRAIQSEGWHFNRVPQRVFNPDSNLEILIPSNVVRLEGYHKFNNVAQRGMRLFDITRDSYEFTSAITLEVVELLDWEDLPQQARDYIFIKAARLLHDRTQASGEVHQFTRQAEFDARAQLTASETKNGNYGILNDINSIATVYREGYDPVI